MFCRRRQCVPVIFTRDTNIRLYRDDDRPRCKQIAELPTSFCLSQHVNQPTQGVGRNVVVDVRPSELGSPVSGGRVDVGISDHRLVKCVRSHSCPPYIDYTLRFKMYFRQFVGYICLFFLHYTIVVNSSCFSASLPVCFGWNIFQVINWKLFTRWPP